MKRDNFMKCVTNGSGDESSRSKDNNKLKKAESTPST